MFRWLVAPAAAPIGGLAVGIAVFVGVLLVTPPGLAAPYWMLIAPGRNPVAMTAAYATGAASALGLVALGLVAALLAAARCIARVAECRRTGEATAPD